MNGNNQEGTGLEEIVNALLNEDGAIKIETVWKLHDKFDEKLGDGTKKIFLDTVVKLATSENEGTRKLAFTILHMNTGKMSKKTVDELSERFMEMLRDVNYEYAIDEIISSLVSLRRVATADKWTRITDAIGRHDKMKLLLEEMRSAYESTPPKEREFRKGPHSGADALKNNGKNVQKK
ncbi:MAG: hypothetical protein ABIH99_03940 [Candidatus Micrarchaeota archaeon]